MKNKKVILVDGSNLVYRMYYVHKNLNNSLNIHTGAIYGFFKMLFYYSRVLKCRNFVLCWESSTNWRNKFYPDYKKNRKIVFPDEINEALKQSNNGQNTNLVSLFSTGEINELKNISEKAIDKLKILFSIMIIKNIAEKAGIYNATADNCESDDVIAYLTKKFRSNVKIISGDKDFMQLVNDKQKIRLIYVNNNINSYKIMNVKEVLDKYDVYPEEFPLYLALKGDDVDDIPGLPGVGEKRAVQLVHKLRFIGNHLKKIITNEKDREIVNRNKTLIDLNVGSSMVSNNGLKLKRNEKIDVNQLKEMLKFLEIKSFNEIDLLKISATPKFVNYIKNKF
ncbi:MAG: 5'-3' exonuclease H3TH domain-containing protein [Candidatus Woesearchaeota archaeon]